MLSPRHEAGTQGWVSTTAGLPSGSVRWLGDGGWDVTEVEPVEDGRPAVGGGSGTRKDSRPSLSFG